MKLMTLAAVLLTAGTARADITPEQFRQKMRTLNKDYGDTGDPRCVPKKKKVVRRPRPPKRPTPPVTRPCDCPPGPRGEKGDRGEPGVTTVKVVERQVIVPVKVKPAIAFRLGVMGTIQAPHGDWAWGPALQLATDLSDDYELAFSAGLAVLADEGLESGHLLHLSVERHLDEVIGVAAGVHLTSIEGSPDNSEIDGDYLSLSLSLVGRTGPLRFEFGPTVGGLRDDFEEGTQLAIGVQGSGFVGFNW